jgi:hypothetical protein
MSVISGFLEHATIELEPGQLAIDESLWARQKIKIAWGSRNRVRTWLRKGFFLSDN